MKFSTNFAAMLSLVGRIKPSLNCFPSLELRDITHAQCTYTHVFTGRISKLGLHSLQSYGCVRITSWITLVKYIVTLKLYEGRLISSRNCFITEIRNRKQKNKIHHKIRLLKTAIELKYYLNILKNKVYMKH